MKLLVTGASGLLGINLIKELVKAGENVKAFVRLSSNLKGLQGVPCQIFRGDIHSYDDVTKALFDCDGIIHAASTTSVMPVEFEFYKKINVDATQNIIRSVLEHGNKRLVYISTANAFAPGTKQNPGNESTPFNLNGYNSGYIKSKQMAQQLVLENVERHNLNAVVVNPTFIIGPYDAKPSSGKIILYGLKHGVQWCPSGGKNFVHAQDVARGVYQVFLRGKQGECYLLTGDNLSYKEFFSLLNQITGRKRLSIQVPKFLIRTAGSLAEAWSNFSDHEFAFNKTNAKILSLDNYYSGEKAKREFNLNSTPIKTALDEALQWFKKENYISEDYSTQGTRLDL